MQQNPQTIDFFCHGDDFFKRRKRVGGPSRKQNPQSPFVFTMKVFSEGVGRVEGPSSRKKTLSPRKTAPRESGEFLAILPSVFWHQKVQPMVPKHVQMKDCPSDFNPGPQNFLCCHALADLWPFLGDCVAMPWHSEKHL